MKEYATCDEVREEFSALLDGELAVDEQDGVEEHLSGCSDCLRELDGLKRVTDLYAELPTVDAPESFAVDLDLESPDNVVDLRQSSASSPISFKPILAAVAVLTLMASVSFLIGRTAPNQGRMELAADTSAESALYDDMDVSRLQSEPSAMAPAPEPLADRVVKEAVSEEMFEAKVAQPKGMIAEMESRDDQLVPSAPKAQALGAVATDVNSDPDIMSFTLQSDGAWHEKGYTNQPLTELKLGDKALVDILVARPELANVLIKAKVIVFQFENTWYRIDPAQEAN